MRLLYLIEILLFSVLTLNPALCFGQDRRSLTHAQIDSILNPKILDGAEKVVRFDKSVILIGNLTEDHEPVDIDFTFQNISGKPLTVNHITTDCGCTEAKSDKSVYGINEKGKITVQYTPKNHVGTIDASTWVYSSISATRPIARLTIRGEVFSGEDVWKGYRHTMGALRLKQKCLNFTIKGGSVQTERILCVNSGSDDLKLSAKELPPFIQFRTEPVVVKPGDEADVVVRVDGAKYTGNESSLEYSIIINGLSAPEKERTLFITVEFSK